MKKRFLIMTLAMNGYQLAYKSFIKTHIAYAKRIGATHVEVSRPWVSSLGVECCWLKLHLLQKALKAGYDDVLILDADTWVNQQAPDIRINKQPGKYIYMAKGYSNRFNSGVLWVQNQTSSLEFISTVINNRLNTIPSEDDVGWGENGHIIHHARQTDIIAELDTCWNNTYDTDLADYIRHYNHGPFRSHWYKRLLHKLLARTSRVWLRLSSLHNYHKGISIPAELFQQEMRKVIKQYPKLVNP